MTATEQRQLPRLKARYNDEIRDQLRQQLQLDNVMQVPRLEKIVVNMGIGDAVADPKVIDSAVRDLATLSGQKPRINRARQSIAGFKLRQGMTIGAKVTLRGDRMWEFFDRLLAVALPRIRDFRGLPDDSFDGRGNYTFGVSEQLIFPEINYDEVDRVRGMDITLVTTAQTDLQGRALLAAYNFPFASSGGSVARA